MPSFVYPPARRGDVVDEYHGRKVADPYRWLEDPDSEETTKWVEAQNELTDAYVKNSKSFEPLRKVLEERWNYQKFGVPRIYNERLFYFKNDGLQNQSVLYSLGEGEEEPTVVIDPNEFSEDGTVAIGSWSCSKDGKIIVYTKSASGSDWQEIHIRRVEEQTELDEVLHHCRWTSISWNEDCSGFFYNRYPAEGEVPEEDRINFAKVFFHKLGTSQEEDQLIWERPEDKTLTAHPETTTDGKYLVLSLLRSCDPVNRLYIKKIGSDAPFLKLIDDEKHGYHFLGSQGTKFYFQNDSSAPRWRVISIDIDIKDPAQAQWKEVIPQGKGVIDRVAITKAGIVVSHEIDAHHELLVYDHKGKELTKVELPTLGSVFGLWGRENEENVYFAFTSFLKPMAIYRYNVAQKDLKLLFEPEVDFDSTPYETRQVFYESKDGTKVPMFITCRKDIELDGSAPTLLYGYGGFAISLTPGYGVPCSVWLEHGGVYVVANLRGGNEYGREWHDAGKLLNKQNVFDDFISAAEYLVDEGYTCSDKLAIWGGSNGGLLTAACMLQRPKLFGAVISAVPVIDMLRYHKFTCGRYWISDYGNAEEDENIFDYVMKYSPLHNVKAGETYPPLIVMTADTDDRVVPSHGKKFIATLQHEAAKEGPLLLHVETKAGHGHGKPTSKRIENRAYMLSFLFETFGLTTENSA